MTSPHVSSLLKSATQPARAFFTAIKSRLHLMPDFLIIGTQRGGTTSLYNYLVGHPSIAPARQKEVHYFDLHFSEGRAWYRAHFPSLFDKRVSVQKAGQHSITGEATPYYIFHPLAPRRISELMPRVKLIALLRNPVDRAYSHYNFVVKEGIETLSFEEALDREAERLAGEVEKIINQPGYYSFNHQNFSYLARGIYADQIRVWLNHFPREQLLIESSEALFQDPAAVLGRSLEFLNVACREPREYGKFNEGDYSPMNPATRRWLRDYFKPHNQRLYECLGVDWHWDEFTLEH